MNMPNQDDIDSLDRDINTAQEKIDLADALERLQSNRDFKTVILQSYFAHEPVRLVHLKADPAMQTDERQVSIMRQMDAIGSLLQFFQAIYQNGKQALKSKEANLETRDALLAGDALDD